MENMSPGEMILQIVSSIRTLDGRISEIKQSIVKDHFKEDAKELMKEKIKRLIETRMMLVYSLMDNKLAFSRYLGEDSKITYENLKRELAI